VRAPRVRAPRERDPRRLVIERPATPVVVSLRWRRATGWRELAPREHREAGAPLQEGLAVVICTAGRPGSLARLLASLGEQERRPEQLVIVDAGPDDGAERVVRAGGGDGVAREVRYERVSGVLRGLTRQRNHALRLVHSDLVAFFDDDVVLLPGCLGELETTLRSGGPGVVGVGGFIVNDVARPALRWRVRIRTGVVTSLAPGRYFRSGMSTPWTFLEPTDALVEGDWLPGAAMLWRTASARAIGFNDAFAGYAQGEDLDFSLRARRAGRLLLAGRARLLHLHEPAGRPAPFRRGYMEIYNRYEIHRRALVDRSWRDIAWFAYAWGLDTLFLLRQLVIPGRAAYAARQIAGRVSAAVHLVRHGMASAAERQAARGAVP